MKQMYKVASQPVPGETGHRAHARQMIILKGEKKTLITTSNGRADYLPKVPI